MINIILLTKNSFPQVGRCLDSILEQKGVNISVFVQDGGSDDGTLELIENAQDRAGPHIMFDIESEPDNGLYEAMNRAVARVKSGLIGFCHSDDYLLEREFLATAVKIVKEKGSKGFASGVVFFSRSSGRVVRKWDVRPFQAKKPYLLPPHTGMFLDKDVYDAVGIFDETFEISSDTDWMLRMFQHVNPDIVYINKPVLAMEIGGASTNGIPALLKSFKEDLRVFRCHTSLAWSNCIMKKFLKFMQLLKV